MSFLWGQSFPEPFLQFPTRNCAGPAGGNLVNPYLKRKAVLSKRGAQNLPLANWAEDIKNEEKTETASNTCFVQVKGKEHSPGNGSGGAH